MTPFNERMSKSAKRARSRLVLALDFSEPYERRVERALHVLDITKKDVAAVKVNHHLLLPFGLQGLRRLIEVCKEEGLPLIADLKMNDIESTNLNIADSLLDYGFDCVIANPFVGFEEGLGSTIGRVQGRGGGVLLLVYMSHGGSVEGYGLNVEGRKQIYSLFAERAREWGVDGVIVSAKSPGKIAETRQIIGKDCMIFSPGIGAQGGDPLVALKAGADYLIAGRSVTESRDPKKAVAELSRIS